MCSVSVKAELQTGLCPRLWTGLWPRLLTGLDWKQLYNVFPRVPRGQKSQV